jgi:ParB family chromosome partitioning protein
MQLPVNKLRPFEGHPFQVKDDAEMDQLVWSILTQGLLTPISVRPMENGEYEVISGHRRLHACKKAGIETVPALIYALDRDAAAIALVDSNLHRERLLPSEKAFAYKLKMEAIRHQGTSGQLGQKWTRDEIAEGDSGRQVQRYIRLTELTPKILAMVDEGKIALTPAVELSYLTKQEQQDLLETM